MKSNLLKSSIIYSGFNLLNAALPFLLIPFLTRYLTTEDYGKISIITLSVTFLSPIIGLSAISIITKEYFNVDDLILKKIVQSILILLIFSLITLFIVFFIFRIQLFYFLNLDYNLLFVCLIIGTTQFLISLTTTILQMENKATLFGLFQFFQALINTLLSIIFIYFFKIGWKGRIDGWLSANIIISFISIYFLFRKSYLNNFKIEKNIIKDVIKYSLPIIPYTLSGMIISMNDRFLVNKILGTSEVGLYTLGLQIGSIINIIFISLNNAFIPWLYKKLSLNITTNSLLGIFYIFIILMIFTSIIFWIFASQMIHLFIGQKFLSISKYLFLFIITNLFNSIYLIFANYFIYKGQTKTLATNTIITTLINLPLCYYLIKYFNIGGAVYATMITSFILLCLTIYSINNLYKFPWFKPLINFSIWKKI